MSCGLLLGSARSSIRVIHLLAQKVIDEILATRVLSAEPGNDSQHHPRDAGLTALQTRRYVDAAVVPQTFVQKKPTRPHGTRIAGRKSKSAQQGQGVGRRDPLLAVDPRCPAARGVLVREDACTPAPPRDLGPLGLPCRGWRCQQVSHGLPADGGIARHEPCHHAFTG
jgi:hypothetical protein